MRSVEFICHLASRCSCTVILSLLCVSMTWESGFFHLAGNTHLICNVLIIIRKCGVVMISVACVCVLSVCLSVGSDYSFDLWKLHFRCAVTS